MHKLTVMLSTRNLLFVIAVTYTLAIGVGSLIHPPQVLTEAPQNSDKLVHAGGYFGLFTVWFVYLYFISDVRAFKRNLLIAITGSLIYGTVIEFLQAGLTSYRSGDFYDVLANATGIMLAALAITCFRNQLAGIKSKF